MARMGSYFVERLSALHRNVMRKVAQECGVLMVHVEVLIYLDRCNGYSDNIQAVSEYLGQTKGSISQTVHFLEAGKFIQKTRDKNDLRVFHLSLLEKGKRVVAKVNKSESCADFESSDSASMEAYLQNLQKQNGLKSFGVCATCKFNQVVTKDRFQCGLTGEELTFKDVGKICREHEL